MNYFEQEKEQILDEILQNFSPCQIIDYKQFLDLYEQYKDKMSEQEFAEILEINYKNFSNVKNCNTRAKILKSKTNLSKEEKELIIKEVLTKVSAGQSINYNQFINLYQPYKSKISEIEFATILNVSSSNFKNMLYKKQNIKILKSNKSFVIDEIKKDISKKVHIGEIIDYNKFRNLYIPYKDILKEAEFAEILDITFDNFNRLKYKNGNVKVLKFQKISKSEVETIILDVLIKVGAGQLINYEQFLKLYEPYTEKVGMLEFANILEVSYSNFRRLTKNKGNIRILKSKIKRLTAKEREEIKNEIFKKVNIGKVINYGEFKKLYMQYESKISEIEFANILGISVSNLANIKNAKTNAIVKDEILIKKINRIKYLTFESRYYTKHEIEILANKFQITIKDLVIGLYNLKQEKQIFNILNLLDTKGKIWYGDVKCSNNFIEKYAKYIITLANKISEYYSRKFNFNDVKEDCISDSILFIYEKCGEIEKNFGENEILVKKIISYKLLKFIKFKYLNRSTKKVITISTLTNNSSNNSGIKDDTVNIEQELEETVVIEELNKLGVLEDKCVYLLSKYLEKGYTKEEAFAMIEKFIGIDKLNLIEMLKQYMTNKQLVKKTSAGKYILK